MLGWKKATLFSIKSKGCQFHTITSLQAGLQSKFFCRSRGNRSCDDVAVMTSNIEDRKDDLSWVLTRIQTCPPNLSMPVKLV